MTDQAPLERDAGGVPLRLRYTALSDVGRVRKDNQDSAYAGPHFLVVADGVGGSARGDVASSAAVEELRALDDEQQDAQAAVAAAIDQAHRRIAGLVAQHPELEGTSTTVTAAIFDGARLWFGHVGDSRAYLLREDVLRQVTTDHTFVQTLIDEGRITEAESRVHPHRNLILRAVDGVHESEPDLFTVDLQPGDRVLLCSDGASGVLDDDALTELLRDGTVEKAARDLIRSALDAGSTDNVTVVVADVVDAGAADPDETQAMQVGPIVVGAAAERRKGIGRRRARRADTGELDAVVVDPQEDELPPARVDPEQSRYAPRAPRRFTWLRRAAVLVVALVLVYAAGSGAYAWSQRQYYVAPAAGKVAIYRGVEASVPFVQLHHVHSVSTTRVADLPSYNRGQVRDGMTTRNLGSAKALVRRLDRAATCQDEATSPSGSPTPSGTPTTSPSGSGSPTASPSRSRTVSPVKPPRRASGSRSATGTPSATSSPTATSTAGSDTGSTDCTDGG